MLKVEPATFIWATALGSKERVAWLKENYNKPITQEQYTAHIQELPHDHRRPSKCKTPSRCQHEYEYLKARFGFFTAEPRVADE